MLLIQLFGWSSVAGICGVRIVPPSPSHRCSALRCNFFSCRSARLAKTLRTTHTAALAIPTASKDARSEKNDADYKVAKEKCDALNGAENTKCETAAKAKYGK